MRVGEVTWEYVRVKQEYILLGQGVKIIIIIAYNFKNTYFIDISPSDQLQYTALHSSVLEIIKFDNL